VPPFFPRRKSVSHRLAQVSWLTFPLLASPSQSPARISGILAAFVPITVAGRREVFTPFPLDETKKNPRTDKNRSGDCPFYPQTVFVSTPQHARSAEHCFVWQVFWLPRPFSDLPIPIHWNSGTKMLKEFPFLQRKGRGYSGGPAPEFNGIPY
jgi:hypothetical protein